MSLLRIGVWNTQWATAGGKRGTLLRTRLAELEEDLLCITEGSRDLLPAEGFTVTSTADYGYAAPAHRRKVLLWSRQPWEDVDEVGAADLPPGRFVRAMTLTPIGAIDVVGICIPWRAAHVTSGRRDRQLWEDHLSFLVGLKSVLSTCRAPALVLGDFNQRIPNRGAPRRAAEALQDVFDGWTVATIGPIPPLMQPSIDHVAHTADLTTREVRSLDRVTPCGTLLSDHFGLSVIVARDTGP